MSASLVNRPRVKVVLHGRLAKKFGGPFEWGVLSTADAIRGLCLQRPGFREEVARGHYRIERRDEGGLRIALDKDALTLGLGRAKELHLFPVARGAKSGGAAAAKIVVGVILIAVAWYAAAALAPALGGLSAGFGSAIIPAMAGVPLLGLTYGGLATIGVGMVLAGAAMLLAPKPKAPGAATDRESKQNFMFNGPQMQQEQGIPVPVNYGEKVRVGGVLIAVDYRAEDLEVANTGTISGGGFLGLVR